MFDLWALPSETHDRRNVRLANRAWNNVCNLIGVIKHEKFVFRPDNGGDSLRDLGAHIQKCKTLRSCWEFQGVRLFQLPSTVWKNCGDRIQSLCIYNSEVNDATIKNIIIHCPNLKHFLLRSEFNFDFLDENEEPITLDAVGFDRERVFCSVNTINRLARRKIKRRNLTSLELYIPSPISNKMLRKFYQIFPCIRTFGQGSWLLEAIDWTTAFENNPANEWVFPPMIENFISNRDDISNPWKMPNLKFKVFSTIFNLDKITNCQVIYNFFAGQAELVKLSLYICKDDKHGGKEIMFHILRRMLKLRELEFHSDHSSRFLFTPTELSDFFVLTSKLESIKTNCGFDADGPALLPSTEYSNLKILDLAATNTSFTFEILKRCSSSLHHLVLDSVDDKILQILLEAHTELRILHINLSGPNFNDDSNENGPMRMGKKYPFGKLIYLEHLRIKDIDPDMLKSILSEFVFPQLKYFDFYCRDWTKYKSSDGGPTDDNGAMIFGIMLAIVSRTASRLEILRLRTCLYKAADFVKHFKRIHMKYLRFIVIDNLMSMNNDWYESNEEDLPLDQNFGYVDKVFDGCPSLRLINFYKLGRPTFSYDRRLKKVKRHPFFNGYNAVQP